MFIQCIANKKLDDVIFLGCVMHYDCIDNPRKKCPTCPLPETMSEIVNFANADPSDAQKKRTRESSPSTEKSSRKKLKNWWEEGINNLSKNY